MPEGTEIVEMEELRNSEENIHLPEHLLWLDENETNYIIHIWHGYIIIVMCYIIDKTVLTGNA